MCGIAGEIRLDGKKADLATVRNMVAVMEQRGPDGSGFFQHEHVAFGHRRLKIIDLSEAAQQPMRDEQLGMAIVFNGCIYNYKELRNELQKKGYHFFSAGDTEVILKSYHAWGVGCLNKFKGMFAFAIWKADTNEVFLARDRFGMKPLYYQHTGQVFRFASTPQALLQAGDVDTSINPVALNYYMSFHGIVPFPHTMVSGIKKWPQAHWTRLHADGKMESNRYWSISCRPEKPGLINEWKERLFEHLKIAVKRHLVADVPVGVLLSGGLDSSLIVALLAEAGCNHIKTFSIGFEDAGGEAGDEFAYSDLMAQYFATDHCKIRISQNELIDHLPDCIAAMPEPMVSWDNIGFYLLSREVSRHIKAVQCGQGADELFAGYRWHVDLLESDNPRQDLKRIWCDRTWDEYRSIVHPSLAIEDYASHFIDDYYLHSRASSEFEKGLELDMSVLITDDPVKRVDSNTMAWSLEARVPFLDHELAEFAAIVPTEYKVRGGSGKWLLKEASRSVVPARVIDRPKGYFPVPMLKNPSGKMLEFIKDIVLSQRSRERNLFRQEYVRELVNHPQNHLTPTGVSKLYQIAVLNHWLDTTFARDADNDNIPATAYPYHAGAFPT